MSITVEAIAEAGVLKPLSPLPNVQEHERVLITIEPRGSVDNLRDRVKIDSTVAQEISESADYGGLES